MRCPKCGSEIQPGAKFCSICGSTLVSNNNEDTVVLNQQNAFVPPVAGNSAAPQYQKMNNTYQQGGVNPVSGNSYPMNNQNFPQPTVTQNKKLSTGAIVAIVVAAVVAVAAISGIIGAIVQQQKAAQAVEDVEIPDIPDFDLDSGLDAYSDSSDASDSAITQFGYVDNQNVYVNEMYDLKFGLPDADWIFYSKDQIYQDYLSFGIPVSFDETNGVAYQTDFFGTAYYDAVMVNESTGSNLQAIIYDIADPDITVDDLFNQFETDASSVYSNVTIDDAGTVMLGNSVYSIKEMQYTTNGTDSVQYFAAAEINDDIIVLTATFISGAQPDAIEFYNQIASY